MTKGDTGLIGRGLAFCRAAGTRGAVDARDCRLPVSEIVNGERLVVALVVALGILVAPLAEAAGPGGWRPDEGSGSGAARSLEPEQNRVFELTPTVGMRYHIWKEFDENGSKMLTESGPLFVVGVNPRLAFGEHKRFFVEADLQLYLGKVVYDGLLQGPQQILIPYTSKTGYFGVEALPTAGYVFSLGRHLQLIPTAGLGFEYWNRDLDDGGAHGYDEKYEVLLVHAGVGGAYRVNRAVNVHLAVGLRMPVHISESVDLSRLDGPSGVGLSPGLSPRFVVKGGSRIHGVDVAAYFETWTLPRSSEVGGVLQPESTRQIIGLQVGYALGVD